MHLVRAGVGAVHLVDHHDRMQPAGQRLADHELGLRQHALGGVHQHDGAVHHVQDALDLAAEIGVAGGVDDVDAGAVPDHRGALGEDGDAALALQVVAVERALGHHLVVAERAGLAEQLVDEGGLAVIDVGDDRDVANLHGCLRVWGWCGAHIVLGGAMCQGDCLREAGRGFAPDPTRGRCPIRARLSGARR